MWVKPMEVIKPQSEVKGLDWLKYEEILSKEKDQFVLKEIQEMVFPYGWFQYYQIQLLYNEDKKERGWRTSLTDLEKILIEEGGNRIEGV